MGSMEINLSSAASFTQHVDDPLVVRRKQPDGVFEQQHERRVDHAVGQLVGVGLRGTRRRETLRRGSGVRGRTSPDPAGQTLTWKSSSASSWF